MKTQKKAIEHIIATLNKVDEYEVYSHISKTAKTLEISNDKTRELLKELSAAQKEFMTDNVRESKEWLQALLDDINEIDRS